MIYGGKSYGSRKLLGILLSRCEDYYSEKLMVTWETREDISKFGKESRDSDTLYQLLFSIKGSRTAVLLREEENDEISCSLRSREPIDVGAVAAEFGGGGHKLASGFSLQGTTLSNVKKQIIDRFKDILV
jgi:phosphoesterase RecJ-like protein